MASMGRPCQSTQNQELSWMLWRKATVCYTPPCIRELEILDNITKLRYCGSLPHHIDGHHRNSLIRQYQQWKGTHHVPALVHPAIQWSDSSPFNLLSAVTDTTWHIPKCDVLKKGDLKVSRCDISLFLAAKGSISLNKTVHNVARTSSKWPAYAEILLPSKKIKIKSDSTQLHTSEELKTSFWWFQSTKENGTTE